MRHSIGGLGMAAVVCGALAVPLDGIYMRVETEKVPVARLAANLERELAAAPRSDAIHVQLARLYGMAYALNSDEVPAAERRAGGSQEVWFGHESNLIPYKTSPAPDATRAKASREYLEKSLRHYRSALELNSANLLARLGYGWTLEQSGDKQGAIAEYRRVIETAWPKEQARKGGGLGERFYTGEAARYLIPLLDAGRDAAEVAELRRRLEHLERLPRAITPIAIPLSGDVSVQPLIDMEARVPFDADGSGQARRWTWITPRAGWLVYDAAGKRQVSSALQMFGSVTFWLFWANGYEALRALDDDADGELQGAELRHLAVWQDADSDGVSDAGEVRPLSHHDIVALSCRFTEGDGLLTAARSASGVRLRDGTVRPTYDVILRPSWHVSAPVPE